MNWEIGDEMTILDAERIGGGRYLTNGRSYEVVYVNDFGSPVVLNNLQNRLSIIGAECQHVAKKVMEEPSATRPDYYHKGGIDVFAYGKANMSKEKLAGFFALNIIKYVTRYDAKNGIEDLEKAEVYLAELLELERGKQ